jgi:hypothetical protein
MEGVLNSQVPMLEYTLSTVLSDFPAGILEVQMKPDRYNWSDFHYPKKLADCRVWGLCQVLR